MRKSYLTETMIKSFIQIPNKPKDYYKGEWKDWNDFLGLNTKPSNNTLTVNVGDKSSGLENANQNMEVLINNDENVVKRYAKGQWNDISMKKDHTDAIKQFLQKRFNVPMDIRYRVCIKKNGSYDKMCVNCAYANIGDFFNVPVIIYPEDVKFKYDVSAIALPSLTTGKYNRTVDEYIIDGHMKTILTQIINK